MKKRILICGIRMNMGGTEKAFLSFLEAIDRDIYTIDLLLAERCGELLSEIPTYVNIIGPLECGRLFSLSKETAVKTFFSLKLKGKIKIFLESLPLLFSYCFFKTKRGKTADKIWLNMLSGIKTFSQEFADTEKYDVCLAFWGERTMFYMCDKVKADCKLAWLHFDYFHPKRDDGIYSTYFKKCDAVISVSHACTELLKKHFPDISDKFITYENILPIDNIKRLSLEVSSFPDVGYEGLRVLSVMRICPQKGYDLIPEILGRLLDDGINLRWYIAGSGSEGDVAALKEAAIDCNVADRLILLGNVVNPYPLMRDCDLFVLPSRFEGKPVTVEEAKALLCPILCTEFVSAREQLDGGRLGMICGFNTDSIYGAMKKLLSSKSLRDEYSERLAEAGRIKHDRRGEFSRILEKYVN